MSEMKNVYTSLGLMSGTSVDGMDAAIIETDGKSHVKVLAHKSAPYPKDLREQLLGALGASIYSPDLHKVEASMTKVHSALVSDIIRQSGITPDIIGFHGQTLSHDPDNGHTFQIGDGALLASETGIDVINDFRTQDVRAGGQGAPLLPLYHKALVESAGLELPVVILNLGGVANVTWIDEDNILAFDTGPASALIDDWISRNSDQSYDKNGEIAAGGKVDDMRVTAWLDHEYFEKPPPKSLDRDDWMHCDVSGLGLENGAATLTAFTVKSIVKATEHFPRQPKKWYATGGGRHNSFMMAELKKAITPAGFGLVDDLGWNGDFIEAEGFAYLAVRSLNDLPLSLPGTTGCPSPQTGGKHHSALPSKQKSVS